MTPIFREAKKAARRYYDQSAREGLAAWGDAASYKRCLRDAKVNARNLFLANRNPEWDDVSPEVDCETGVQTLAAHQPALLASKREYDEQLGHLDDWFQGRERYWLQRYALEGRTTLRLAGPAGSRRRSILRISARHFPFGVGRSIS